MDTGGPCWSLASSYTVELLVTERKQKCRRKTKSWLSIQAGRILLEHEMRTLNAYFHSCSSIKVPTEEVLGYSYPKQLSQQGWSYHVITGRQMSNQEEQTCRQWVKRVPARLREDIVDVSWGPHWDVVRQPKGNVGGESPPASQGWFIGEMSFPLPLKKFVYLCLWERLTMPQRGQSPNKSEAVQLKVLACREGSKPYSLTPSRRIYSNHDLQHIKCWCWIELGWKRPQDLIT